MIAHNQPESGTTDSNMLPLCNNKAFNPHLQASADSQFGPKSYSQVLNPEGQGGICSSSPSIYSDAPIADRVKQNKRGLRQNRASQQGSRKNSQNAPLSSSSH